MRKTVALLLFMSMLFFTSCASRSRPCDVVSSICMEYPIDATVYSSTYLNGEKGYINSEMLLNLYDTDDLPADEFAIVLYGKVGNVREIGVFATSNGYQKLELITLISKRIEFLDSFAEGEGFVKKYRGAVAYGFVDNAEKVISILDKVM